ncbi:MAG: DNA recombination protein RmuC, partial [Oscillospiraceae bacterium]
NFSERQSSSSVQIAKAQDMRLQGLQVAMTDQMKAVNTRFVEMSAAQEQRLENIRTTMEKRITSLQEENTKSLDQMRQTVDEKLQKTLDEKLKQSFSMVSERLEQVYKGLGEMQTLAIGVGDLKKVLSNVKTRGILGEIQLGAILEQMLSHEQYEENVKTRPNSAERVEFAVKLPGDGETPVYLPIDAKFPADAYTQLLDAYDTGNAEAVAASGKLLETRIKSFAKDIHEKYIEVPYTTDFAILFLPTEGLYAEVVRRGLIETLQNEYKINIAGPTTMAALLNSLQMGFKTLAIQKRSSEVWQVLGGVKNEFDNFARALAQTQSRIKQADDELEKLIGVRTRQMQRKLKNIEAMPLKVLEDDDVPLDDLPLEDMPLNDILDTALNVQLD